MKLRVLTRQFNSVQESLALCCSRPWAGHLKVAEERRQGHKHCFNTEREELPMTDVISPFSEQTEEEDAKPRLGEEK